MTGPTGLAGVSGAAGATGYMILPTIGGAAYLQWGSVPVVAASSAAVLFPIAFTACDSVQFLMTALASGNPGFYASAVGPTGFTANFNGSITGTVYWMAWGR